MGYRSDVRIMTSKKGFNELKKFVNNYLKKDNEGYYDLLEHLNIKEENDYACYFGWNWIKWYEGSYKDVDAIIEGLEHLREKDFSFRFSRIGESYDDYEEDYHDSEKEEEQDLEFPSMLREFDDDYVIDNMHFDSSKKQEVTSS